MMEPPGAPGEATIAMPSVMMNRMTVARLIGSDELEEAYLYGLAAENTASDIYESTVASNAVTASTYKEKMYSAFS